MLPPIRTPATLFLLLALPVVLGSPLLRGSQSPSDQPRVYQENQTNAADLNDSYDVFYDQLSSDGHWIFVENYGYVFQPNVAETYANWRPYTNGHWESTDRGWYWDTDEPFGWATYHYGRWANIDGTGWVWAPGIDWSPAWVSWRVCDNGYIGWAPLPPECPRPSEAVAISDWCDSYTDTGPAAFCFLPIGAWFNPSYAGAFAPFSQNLELLNASRNVTNISASKSLISAFGPRVDFIAQETGRQVKTYTLHYSEVAGRHNFSRAIDGTLLNVNGPVAKLKANATKVPTVIKTIVRPTMNKGWNGLTKDAIDGVHRKYAAEAHIPSHLPTRPDRDCVNLVPSGTPAIVRSANEQKPKESKDSKQTGKGTGEKGSKGKAAGAAEHKDTGKHKTASKGEGALKGKANLKPSLKVRPLRKTARSLRTTANRSLKRRAALRRAAVVNLPSDRSTVASKSTDDTDESESQRRRRVLPRVAVRRAAIAQRAKDPKTPKNHLKNKRMPSPYLVGCLAPTWWGEAPILPHVIRKAILCVWPLIHSATRLPSRWSMVGHADGVCLL